MGSQTPRELRCHCHWCETRGRGQEGNLTYVHKRQQGPVGLSRCVSLLSFQRLGTWLALNVMCESQRNQHGELLGGNRGSIFPLRIKPASHSSVILYARVASYVYIHYRLSLIC